jgi:TRAP-type C4-dicarboxylate transport system permease small subunit
MKLLKKIGLKLLDFIEVVMPVIALSVTFFSFIVNVIARYLVNAPINACYELCLGGLVWCLLLSAPYAARKHTNVAFTLLYDKMNATTQLIFRLVGNAFLIFCFAEMLYPCYDWVSFMHRKYTAVLKIRMDIMYSPFVVFNVLTLGHLVYDFISDVILTIRAIGGKSVLVKSESSMEIDQAQKDEGGEKQ